jgi:methyl-accepting chemotaxis protein
MLQIRTNSNIALPQVTDGQTTEALLARIAELEQNQAITRSIFDNLAAFGESLIALRESFSSLSALLFDNSQANEDTRRQSGESHAGLQRMTRDISDISRHILTTSQHISTLNSNAGRIGGILSMIDDVSRQTKLLAFNASIEAARAGEAGKGFAVVASEVKNLAGQTAHAAEEVTAEIGQMQRLTQAAVDSVRDIHANIAEIDAGARHVAEAVQQQNHVVGDIGRQIEAAVARMRRIADIVREVADGTTESDHSVRSVRQAAEEMKRQSAGLDERVRHFVGKVLAVS